LSIVDRSTTQPVASLHSVDALDVVRTPDDAAAAAAAARDAKDGSAPYPDTSLRVNRAAAAELKRVLS